MHNLGLGGFQMFYHIEEFWGHQCLIQYPASHLTFNRANEFVPILWLLKNLKVVAFVECDSAISEVKSKGSYWKWVGKYGTQRTGKALLRSMLRVRAGWEKAREEGRKRPTLRSISLDGNWDTLEAEKVASGSF